MIRNLVIYDKKKNYNSIAKYINNTLHTCEVREWSLKKKKEK